MVIVYYRVYFKNCKYRG